MIQLHIRIDDELHRRLFNAAHDARQSLNAYVTEAINDKVEQ